MNDMTNEIKVSIIMPVYNSGKYLRPAVDSILTQSMKEFELILVDDGSSDGSEKVCDEYAQAHPEGTFPIVRVIHQKNGGICKARNVAFSESRGEYIGFCDHDDIYLPGLIETAYTKAKQYDADVVKWGVDEKQVKSGKESQKRTFVYPERIYTHEDIRKEIMKMLQAGLFNFIWDAFYRREFVEKQGLKFDEWFKRGGEDITFMLDLVGRLPVFVTLPQVYYRHYFRIGVSSSSEAYEFKAEEFYRVKSMLSKTIDKLGSNNDEIKDDYLRFALGQSCAIIGTHARTALPFNKKNFLNELKKLRNEGFIPQGTTKVDVIRACKNEKIKKRITYKLLFYNHDSALMYLYYSIWKIKRIVLSLIHH